VSAGNVNALYAYTPKVFDPDQDATTITLTSGPSGMVWDAADQRVEWTPTAGQIGSHTVTLTVSDGQLSNTQTYTVLVDQQLGNHKPVIVSQPAVTSVLLGSMFDYDVDATDADGDAITYSLVQTTSGMTIDAASGRINWPATAPGQFTIVVKAADTRGGYDTQQFTIMVENVPGASLSGTFFDDADHDGTRDAGEGPLVGWTVFLDQNGNGLWEIGERSAVTDAAGAFLLASLSAGTFTVAERRQAGWVQTAPVAGTHQVTVTAGQSVPGIDFGNYQSTLTENQPPTITSEPPRKSSSARLAVRSQGHRSQRRHLSSTCRSARRMTIDSASGIAVWTPTLAQEGPHDDRARPGRQWRRLSAAVPDIGLSAQHGAGDHLPARWSGGRRQAVRVPGSGPGRRQRPADLHAEYRPSGHVHRRVVRSAHLDPDFRRRRDARRVPDG
jgi:YD repeat-containing protein